MAAAKYDIKINQGADFKLVVTIKDPNGVVIDLTGHVFRGDIRKTISDTEIIAPFTFNLIDPTNGVVEIIMANAVSSAIELDEQDKVDRKVQRMSYDIESEDGGIVVRWLEGAVEFSPEVTR